MPPALTPRQQMLGVSVIVAALTAAATAWAHWLDPRLLVGVMPATGVLLAALLLLEPRYWAAPIVAAGVAILGVGLLVGLDARCRGAPAAAAVVGALVGACALRAYASGSLHPAGRGRRRGAGDPRRGRRRVRGGRGAAWRSRRPATPRSTTGRGPTAPASPTPSACSSSRPRCSRGRDALILRSRVS